MIFLTQILAYIILLFSRIFYGHFFHKKTPFFLHFLQNLKTKEQKISEMQNEKMQIIGGIFLMFSQGKITKEELDKVTAIENDLSTLESKNKENQYIG